MTHKPLCSVYIASCDENGGIYRFVLDQSGGLTLVDQTALPLPMYLAVGGGRLYALLRAPFADCRESGLVSFAIAPGGRLADQSAVLSTRGEVACHLAVGDAVYCANYVSGSVVKMPETLVVHQGSGADPVRQAAPHAHQVVFTPDGRYVCAVDLGLDQIIVYDQELAFVSRVSLPAGHGPRHMVFAPDGRTAFCANELQSTVTVLRYAEGRLTAGETCSTLPGGYGGGSAAAAIRLSADGKRLYVSNRGHNSIACYETGQERLRLFDIADCGGDFPRDFHIAPGGDFLICANERSHTVTVFSIENGRLAKTGAVGGIKSPLCVLFGGAE